MKKLPLLMVLILASLSPIFINAYDFDYPTPYYYNRFTRDNEKINMSFINQFYNFTPDYLRDNLNIEFTTRQSNYLGYAYCYSKPNGRIDITIYLEGWIDYDNEITEWILEHELKHAYQCRIQNEYPNHNKEFYGIILK